MQRKYQFFSDWFAYNNSKLIYELPEVMMKAVSHFVPGQHSTEQNDSDFTIHANCLTPQCSGM